MFILILQEKKLILVQKYQFYDQEKKRDLQNLLFYNKTLKFFYLSNLNNYVCLLSAVFHTSLIFQSNDKWGKNERQTTYFSSSIKPLLI